MVEFAVLGLQSPAGANRPDTFSCNGMHIQVGTVIALHINPPHLILPAKPYLQGTRPFGRSYYNVHSYLCGICVQSPHCDPDSTYGTVRTLGTDISLRA
jgi:hypothetical protein